MQSIEMGEIVKSIMEEYGESVINYIIGTMLGSMLATVLIVISLY